MGQGKALRPTGGLPVSLCRAWPFVTGPGADCF